METVSCHHCVVYAQESYQIIGAAMKVHAIIVELKAVKELDDVHRSQAINYAKVAGLKLALLINFGESSLISERFPAKRQSKKQDKACMKNDRLINSQNS